MAAIVVNELAKTYRYHRKEPGLLGSVKSFVHRRTLETQAVSGVSFSIEQGEVVGFLGPNGAGKTTTLKMLCSFPLEVLTGRLSTAELARGFAWSVLYCAALWACYRLVWRYGLRSYSATGA